LPRYRGVCVQKTLIYRDNGPIAGSASKLWRSRVFFINEKLKILDMNEREKIIMLRLPGFIARTILPFVN
jgi:hypothetical protein